MADDEVQTTDYREAVRQADEALAVLLEQVPHTAAGVYGPRALNQLAAKFCYDWLYQHGPVHEALVRHNDVSVPSNVDEYILSYSAAFEMLSTGNPDDGALIRRKAVH